ncbi:nitrate- and nitrite sensing domain-containing protein [Halothiobacillus sp. DCM-1]|uniref:nitrate- and nitrite sensing domain-containing protein n=1 Tax=Halothiobacillus sp. DCM-1 TaxID=3112558 RepID=UPI00324BBF24
MTQAIDFLHAAQRSELAALQQLVITGDWVRAISGLVHALQRERGFSNLYLTSPETRLGADLAGMVAASSQAEDRLRRHWDGFVLREEGSAERVRLLHRLALATALLDNLPRLRQRIRERSLDVHAAVSAFTHLIAALLSVVFEAADTAVDPEISAALVALFNFMHGKELAGQERAAGVIALAQGQYSSAWHQRLHFLQEGQVRGFAVCAEFADAASVQALNQLESAPISQDVQRFRQVLAKISAESPVDPALGQVWFEVCTRRIDALQTVEQRLTDFLAELGTQKIARATAALTDQREWLDRLAALEEPGEFPTLRLYHVQATELDAASLDQPGKLVGRSLLDVLHERNRHLQTMQDELESARQSLAERKLIERAKGRIMALKDWPEEEAYRWLRQQAMSRGVKLVELAQQLLSDRSSRLDD